MTIYRAKVMVMRHVDKSKAEIEAAFLIQAVSTTTTTTHGRNNVLRVFRDYSGCRGCGSDETG